MSSMRLWVIGALCGSLLLGEPQAIADAREPEAPRCDRHGIALAKITAANATIRGAAPSLEFIGPQADMLKLWSVTSITGSCAGEALAYSDGVLHFPYDIGFKLDGSGGALKRVRGAARSNPYSGSVVALPGELNGAQLIMADEARRLLLDGHSAIRYVALWKRRGKSIVGTFRVIDGGPAQDVIPLIVTAADLKSVAFFPDLHGSSGRLLILARNNHSSAEVIGVDWSMKSG
ncbi:hypothetical protein DMC47_25685 [Nostoc sp. 3335mG]|nr:hypothetical protein DMC47_25685 [Nostoc sp. 3335mG]